MRSPVKNLLRSLAALVQREDAPLAELQPSVPQAEAEVAAARERVSEAEEAYRRGLVGADDAQLATLDAARREASTKVDRAEALLTALKERLAVAQEREAEAARVEVYQAAQRQAREAAEVLRSMYPAACADIVGILRAVAEAEVAVAEANKKLPRGAERLPGVEESVRLSAAVPEAVISEEVVTVWLRLGQKDPASLDQSLVRFDRNGAGYIVKTDDEAEYLVGRRFAVRRYRPAIEAKSAERLIRSVVLPGLLANDPSYHDGGGISLVPLPVEQLLSKMNEPVKAAILTSYDLIDDFNYKAEKRQVDDLNYARYEPDRRPKHER